ncbi:MAG TPA: hypothetical protein VMW69_14600 [Spirochaetia bacterium]|nr:hypothetical protein [Spirochaetia bacterium]
MVRRLPLIFLFLLSTVAAHAAELYQSNELGMEIAPISAAEAAGNEWVLRVQRTRDIEVRSLAKKGEEVARWEDTYQGGRLASESKFEGSMLAQITDYRNGHPSRQIEYTEGKESLVRDYEYSGNQLRSVTVSDGSGKLQYRDLYSEGPDGRLRRAVRETPEGANSVTLLNYSGDRIISEWLGSGGNGVFFRYSDGALVATEEWQGVDLQTEVVVSQGTEGSVSTSKNLATGATTKKIFDATGKIQSEQVTEKGAVTRSVDYTYAGGILETKVTKTPGQREEIRYKYDAEGQLISSQTTVNRQLVKVTHYTGKDSYFEDLYLGGQVVLHVFYEKGKKVREVPASSSEPIGAGIGAGG